MLELEVVPERSLGCEQWEFILGKWRNTRDVSQLCRITHNFPTIELIYSNWENDKEQTNDWFSASNWSNWCCCHVIIRTLLFRSICKHLVWQSRVNKENGGYYEYFVAHYVIVYMYCLIIETFWDRWTIKRLVISRKLMLV